MKKLAAWSWWLDGCIWGVALILGAAQAAPPPDVVIASAAEAQAFSEAEPFVFAGQTLNVQSSFSTDRDIRLERFAPVIVGPGIRFELQGKVSSTGLPLGTPLEKQGPGTLVLAGSNSYRSNTVLREGVLHLKGASALGDSLYSLEQHGGTVLHLDPGARVHNFLQLVETRPGDTALPGLEGVAQWQVDAGSATLHNNINALLPVRKTGAGTLRLGGIVQGHSSLHVEAGALAVDSVTAARVSIGGGARLEGQGELAHLRVHEGGMVAPGGRDRPGALSVWGNVVFEADSLFHVNADPDGDADLLQVGGQAVLDGRVLAQAGDGEWAGEHRYLILSADGGLDGTRFAGVNTDLAFLDPSLQYDERNVYLTLQRNDLQPGDVAETPDEKEVGDALAPPDRPRRPRPVRPPRKPIPSPETEKPVVPDREVPGSQPPEPEQPAPETPEPELPGRDLPDAEPTEPVMAQDAMPSLPPGSEVAQIQPLTPLEEVMQGMSVKQLRSMLRQSSGSWHASVRSFLLEDSRHVRQAVLNSGRDAWELRQYQVNGNAHGVKSRHARAVQPEQAAGWRGWVQTYSAHGQRQAVGSAPGDHHHSHGIVLGLDAAASRHWRLGLAMAAQQSKLKRSERQAEAKVDSLHAGLSAHADHRLVAQLASSGEQPERIGRPLAGAAAGRLRRAQLAGCDGTGSTSAQSSRVERMAAQRTAARRQAGWPATGAAPW